MDAPNEHTTPSRSGMRRLITPWEYQHHYAAAGVRFAAGGFHLGIGVVLLSLGHRSETSRERRKCYRWAAWFLVHAALLLLSGGYLDMTVARSSPSRT
jgi:hypothetical protein